MKRNETERCSFVDVGMEDDVIWEMSVESFKIVDVTQLVVIAWRRRELIVIVHKVLSKVSNP